MKLSFILFLIVTCRYSVVFSQNTIPSEGNVGIGTVSPSSALDVRGMISTSEIAFRNADGGDDSDPYRMRKVSSGSNLNWLELQINDDFNESFRIYGNSCSGYSCGNYSNNLYHLFDASGNAYHRGNLLIGTDDSKGYRLAVGGPVIAESIKVKIQSEWPDFVLRSSYNRLSLSELESFIKTNQHLPEIPSAKEVEEEGVSLGEMDAKLLKKIEELTLYLIENSKELAEANRKILQIEDTLKQYTNKVNR